MRSVVIVSAARTPIASFQGALKDISATKLGAVVIEEVLKRAGVVKGCAEEVIMGNVLPAGLGQNPARQAMLLAGLPVDTAAFTVNKVCGSGLMAVMLGARSIISGEAEIVIAGGMENMSRVPYYLEEVRTGYRMWDRKMVDGMVRDGLFDVVNNFHMGHYADLAADRWPVSREEADDFTFNSYWKALESIVVGKFKKEIVSVADTELNFNFDTDEIPRETTKDGLAKLKPVFSEYGKTTAGNSSKIADGAAAVLLMSGSRAKKLGLKPMAKIVAQATAGIEPQYVLMAPIYSIPKVLKKAGLVKEDIDLYEINEAFAASTVAVMRELKLDKSKVNVRGGAVALGHPIGASGARILVTLLHAMQDRDAKRGMATLCLGGGEAVSLIVER